MFSGSLTLSVLAQYFSTVSQNALAEQNPHGTSLESYRSPVGAINGQLIPTTYDTGSHTSPYGR